MSWELVVVGLLLALALGPLLRGLRSAAWRLGLVLVFLGGVGAALGWHQRSQARVVERAALAAKAPRESREGGYTRSVACQSCHPGQYHSWHQSFHRTMTQYPTPENVRGEFTNVTLELHGNRYQLERRGDEFRVDMVKPDWTYVRILQTRAHQLGRGPAPPVVTEAPRTNIAMSLMTGSHHMQAYWVPSDFGNMQFGFPFTYLFEENRWVPRDDVFLRPPDDPFTMQVWNVNCINCHSTAGQPRQDPKTHVIDSQAAEMGISCEACHGPAERHIATYQDPKRRYAARLARRGDDTIFNPARSSHTKASEVCGQCHAVRHQADPAQWNLFGSPFRPGGNLEAAHPLTPYEATRAGQPENLEKSAFMDGTFWSDGDVRVSGRDFSGMSRSACYTKGELSCLSCHSMHQYASPTNQMVVGHESNRGCVSCHADQVNNVEKHTHHRAGSSGSSCYNCHMPHTTYGLLKAIRTHYVHSPTVKESVATGRPNACNLCHLDKSLAWTGVKLAEWYGRPLENAGTGPTNISAAAHWLLTGDAGQRAVMAWHLGWGPAREISGEDWMAPLLARLLEDPYSVVRYIAGRSLRRLPGFAEFRYDYIGPASQRTVARNAALEIWSKQSRPAGTARSEVLLDDRGRSNQSELERLLSQRNNRRLELLE